MCDETKNEIIYELETCIPKDSYIKPLYGRISRKYIILRRVLTLLIAAGVAVLAVLNKSSVRTIWIILLICILIFNVLVRVMRRKNSTKHYEKIHAAKEDCLHYTFYKDHAIVKSPTVEVKLNYDTAEFLAENDKRLMINFPFNQAINIEKSEHDEEQLAFFRSIDPEEKQKKTEKDAARRFFMVSFLMLVYTVILAVVVALTVKANARTNHPEHHETTYVSFEACLYDGTVDDIVIINNKYIEYTFFGREEAERYFTIYSGNDIDSLTEIFDGLSVSWESK